MCSSDLTTTGVGVILPPVTMRAAPTALANASAANTFLAYHAAGTTVSPSSVGFSLSTANSLGFYFTWGAPTLTAGQGVQLGFSGVLGYLGWAAEIP